jgi:hypothetical protein
LGTPYTPHPSDLLAGINRRRSGKERKPNKLLIFLFFDYDDDDFFKRKYESENFSQKINLITKNSHAIYVVFVP